MIWCGERLPRLGAPDCFRLAGGLKSAGLNGPTVFGLSEHLRRIVQVFAEQVEYGAVSIESLLRRRSEQLLAALEMVVERSHPTSAALGDLDDRHFSFPSAISACAADTSAARVCSLRRSSRFGSGPVCAASLHHLI